MNTSIPLLSIILFLPLAGAILLTIFRTAGPKIANLIAVIFSFLSLAATIFLGIEGIGEGFSHIEEVSWIPSLGAAYRLGVDGISYIAVLLTTVLFMSSITFSTKTIARKSEYMALFLLLETACLGVFMSLDLLLFYIFFEITLVGMYFIIAGWGHGDAKKAALMFFIYTLVGSLALLLALLGLYLNTGSETFDMREIIANPATGWMGSAIFWGLLIAFAIKTPLFPFHSWLPLAHTKAPAAGSAILAGILLKLGAYGFIRFMLQMTPEAFERYAWIVIIIAVISVVYGALVAMAQTDIKRMVAYTSINHMGYLAFGVAIAALDYEASGIRALDGASLQIFSHGMVTGLLFLLCGSIQDRTTTREMPALKGLLKAYPLLSGFFVLAAFASLGLPGLAHFPAEFQIFLGGYQIYPWAVGIMLVGLVITSAMYLRAIQGSFMGSMDASVLQKIKDLNTGELLAFIPLVILIIMVGIFPDTILSFIHETTKAIKL
ncbi:NuoM family protein [Zunongwangia sp. H14]|uniref:complex I subunit 4 family protein n=1 Tax=Zunongwangia sp. H14 TaxID=3240792 RepID=UPI003561C454